MKIVLPKYSINLIGFDSKASLHEDYVSFRCCTHMSLEIAGSLLKQGKITAERFSFRSMIDSIMLISKSGWDGDWLRKSVTRV
ncbi:hypothetical protein MXB_4868 [Myxobolus squamalis]|nr:hypothetical protein MXB_4868 [Myxobolus squamalis]